MINKYPVLYLVILLLGIALVAVAIQPMTALADGETPVDPGALPVEVVTQPAEGPSEIIQPVEVIPTEEAPAEMLPTESPIEVVPGEAAPSEVAPAEESSLENGVVSETPVTEVQEATLSGEESTVAGEEQAPATEVPTGMGPTPESTTQQPYSEQASLGQSPSDQSLAVLPPVTGAAPEDVSDSAASTAVDAGAPVQEASIPERISNLPDPYIDRIDGRYRFLTIGGCAAFGGVGVFCQESANPIQAAINGAHNGETVNVEAGTYAEQLQIINMTLTIRGIGRPTISAPNPLLATGAGFAVVYAQNSVLNFDGFAIDASTATDGNVLDNSIFGIFYDNSSGTISNNVILGNTATTDNTSGIYVNNSDAVTRTINIVSNTVANYNTEGIFVEGSNMTASIMGNTVTSSVMPDVGSAAIRVDGSSGHTIANNTIYGSNVQGIDVRDSSFDTITGNHISGASIYGVSLINADSSTVTLNIITNTNGNAVSAGVNVNYDSDGNFVAQNALSFNSIAVSIMNGSDDTLVASNRIINNIVGVRQGVDPTFAEPTGSIVTYNIFTLNTTDIDNTSVNNIYAGFNWWGCKEGPPTCGTVTGDVTTDPPLTSDPDPDADLFFDGIDNCQFVFNPDQTDSNGNGIGDACENITASFETQTYKIFANFDPDVEMVTYAATLTSTHPSAFQLVDLQADGSETELARVYYAVGISPNGTMVTFKQFLLENLPKPLNPNTVFLGPAFALGANSADGVPLTVLTTNMELRWKLPSHYTPPAGYKLAVHYFDNRTSYWITEEWQDVEISIAGDFVYAHDSRLGSYMLVLVPDK